ncbi:hypothetical protein [Asticcacaulis solisilvae]|uniref:hypothetical protein n=1 Tax=Asticcacaulis solisilvae TaxID=1217274 RepID=UPI003FD77BA9
MSIYSLDVIRNYWQKIQDGTLWTLNRLHESGRAREDLYRSEESDFLHILPKSAPNRSLDDYMQLVRNDEGWDAFEAAQLDPCFLYEANLHPFETPVAESDSHAADPTDTPDHHANDNGEAASAMSPAQIIELSLAKIEHRFPGDEDWGDKDIRDLIATQTFVFQSNYDNLTRRRRANVRLWMRLAMLVFAAWAWWTLESLSSGVRPLHDGFAAMVAYAGLDLGKIAVQAVFSPWTCLIFTLGAFWGAFAWARHIHGLQRLRFVASTRASSATVAKSVTSRMETILYVARALIEEIDRGKDDAWDNGTLKPWATATQKLVKLVFWCDQRIYGIEDYLRMHMKLVGLCNDGIRQAAKFKALFLVYRHATFALVLPVVFAVTGTLALGWHIGSVANVQTPVAFAAVTVAVFALFLKLHSLIKGQEAPESVYNLISWAATRTMKGYRDSRLYMEMAAFITREKRRLLREEEKRRA